MSDKEASAMPDASGEHLTDEQFAAYHSWIMPADQKAVVDKHLQGCKRCAEEMLVMSKWHGDYKKYCESLRRKT